MAARLAPQQMASVAARRFQPGEVVALGPGWPGLIVAALPPSDGVTLVADSGALGYRTANGSPYAVDSGGQGVALLPGGTCLSLVDLAGMLRGGHVDTAVVQAAQVSANGDYVHWTTAATPGLFAPGAGVDLAGARRVIALLPHTDAGKPNILAECGLLVDGLGCVSLIVTDVSLLRVAPSGLELAEVAPGWRAEDIRAMTGAPLRVADNIAEMRFDVPARPASDKVFPSGLAAVADIPDGATVMIDGFGGPGGMPHYLMVALRDHGARELTIVSNTAGIARIINFGTPPGRVAIDHSILIENHQVKKAIASYPVSPRASRPSAFELAYRKGEVELELSPQGTLAERLRAGGAGVAAFYTPTGVGTLIAEGKETRVINGREYVLEQAIRADFCVIRGHQADTLGNVVYRGTSRNFNAVMAPAARVTIVEVDEIVPAGQLGPEAVVTPGVFVQRIVRRPPDFSPYE